jgi:mannonate dehydratase
MRHCFRWFGPSDPVRLEQIRQAGATGVVSALHDVPAGQVWTVEALARHRRRIEAAGLSWKVVESIPVPDVVKYGGSGRAAAVETFKRSLQAVGEAGIPVVCYNFMPVLDWTRTDLRWRHPVGGLALRFDWTDLAAYDLCSLQRRGAEQAYSADLAARARERWNAIDEAARGRLERTILEGLPGSDVGYSGEEFRRALSPYDGLDAADLQRNLIEFLAEVVPVAAEAGVRLALHPDDPPFPLFGLPRVVSTAEDYEQILTAVDQPENGMTLCTGSLGASRGNDPAEIAHRFADRIQFAHLRNVTVEADGSFYEDEHLTGRTDMVAVIDALLREERRRAAAGRSDTDIPMRPDHGHLLADDVDKPTNPGYSYIGRLKGLAELRGVETALSRHL